jgi:uncharacterized protein
MLKWLILIAVVALVLFGAKFIKRGLGKARTPTVESMVACRRCGVNMPRSDAITADDHYYCCEQHRDEDAK